MPEARDIKAFMDRALSEVGSQVDAGLRGYTGIDIRAAKVDILTYGRWHRVIAVMEDAWEQLYFEITPVDDEEGLEAEEGADTVHRTELSLFDLIKILQGAESICNPD